MSSLKKNFSIDKLYSDLEKYENNLNAARDSRVRKTASGASLHRVASSHGHQRTHVDKSRNNGVNRFLKAQADTNLELAPHRSKYPAQNIENTYLNERNKFRNSNIKDYQSSNCESILKEKNCEPSLVNSHKLDLKFSRSDEVVFLKECNKMYGLDNHQQQEEDSVKILLREINKRDEIYELVCKRLGKQCTIEKLHEFFLNYERMRAIVEEFKRMSKLDIEDEEELYNFLRSEDNNDQQ